MKIDYDEQALEKGCRDSQIEEDEREMPVVCFDVSSDNSCAAIGVIGTDMRVILAGTTVYAMPVKDRNEEYERFAAEYDVQFIFEDRVPAIDFYTIPHVEIFAADSREGWLGQVQDGRTEDWICYIDRERNCWKAAESMDAFVKKAPAWRGELEASQEIQIYASKAEAEKEYEFLEIEGWEKPSDGPSSVLFSVGEKI